MGFTQAQKYNRLKGMLNDLMKESLKLNHTIKEAKTDFKKTYYKNKLKKINNKAANVLMALQLVAPPTETKNHISVDNIEKTISDRNE